MTEKNLREYMGLKAPKVYSQTKRLAGVDPDLLYGIELEIEGLEAEPENRVQRCVAGVQYHEDGSLRNNGGEFVTSPMNFATLEDVLTGFFHKNKFTEENYSERCSVHVHANCQDLTINQIRLVIAVYQVLEKVLFNFIKNDRENNIFCVPLSESIIGTRIMTSPEELMQLAHRKWRKYTALNLLPLFTQGTLEFRHMAGTKDYGYILQWCDIIGSIFKYARNNQFDTIIKDIQRLNTSSAYGTFMQGVFPGHLYDILAVGKFREHLEEGVINMKCMLAPRPKGEKASKIESKPEEAMINGRVVELELEGVNPWEEESPQWSAANQSRIDRRNMDLAGIAVAALVSFQEQGSYLYGNFRAARDDPALREWLRRYEIRTQQRAAALNRINPPRPQPVLQNRQEGAVVRGLGDQAPQVGGNFGWNPAPLHAEIRLIPNPEEGDF